MNKVTKQKRQERISFVIFFSIIVILLVNSILFYRRFDATESKVFTISKTTQDIVQSSEDTIYIDYYISPKLKTATNQPQQMIDLLQEYQSRSNGHVVFTERNTDTLGVLQDAESNQLEQQQIQVVEQNQATYAVVYSGIVISYQGRKKIIPFFLDSSSIEYQLTSKIQELLTDDNKVVGILILDDVFADENTLSGIRQILSSDFELLEVEADAEIDESVDALVVVGSQNATNDTAYYLDQFLMSGKGVYFATDVVKVNLESGLTGVYQNNILHSLLKQYGVEIEDTIVVDKYNKLIPLSGGRGIQTLQQYPMWITVIGDNVSQESPITSRFAGLDLYWTSPLNITKNKENFTTLASSSEESWTVSYQGAEDEEEAEEGEGEEERVKTYVLAPSQSQFVEAIRDNNRKSYSLTESYLGPLNSAVAENLVTRPDDVTGEDYKEATTVARFVITGSSYFLSYLTRVTNANYNLAFISNAVSWLSSDEKLLEIKTRTLSDSRLNKIQDTERRNNLIFTVQIWNMVVIPLIIIIIAIAVFFIRKKRISRKLN